MKTRLLIAFVLAIGAVGAQAIDSLYTGPDNGEFTNSANWSAGVPNHDLVIDGFIDDSVVQLSYNMLDDVITGDDRARSLTISNGTFNVKSGGNYQTENGGIITTWVGVGDGNTGNLNIESGGMITLLGANADLIIGEVGGAQGFVTAANGSTIRAKTYEVLNGQLTLGATISGGTIADKLVVDNAGTLAFQTDGATVGTIPGATLAVELGSTSTLDMQLGGAAPLPGQTWTIVTDVSGITGTFGTVTNSLVPSDKFTVHYGTAPAAATEIVVEYNVAVVVNNFTDGSSDGTWANAANWEVGVPSASTEAIVNSDLTANLSGGNGTAKSLDIGTVDGQSGTVSNGSLTVAGATQVGVASSAVGVLSLTTFNSGTAADDMSIGVGDGASGSVTAGSGTVTGDTLLIGSGVNGSGELDMGTGSVNFTNISVSTADAGTSGTLNAGSITFDSLVIGNRSGSTGSVTAATSFAQSSPGIVSVGYGDDSQASFTGTGGSINSGAANVLVGYGNNSTASVNIGSGSISLSGSLRVGSGDGANGTLTAGTVSLSDGGDLYVATGTDSTGTVSVTSITLDSTNSIYIGTGDNSSHNLTASQLNITGPIGSFGVGEGTGASIANLINLYDSIGWLQVNAPLTITDKDHQISALYLNADLTLDGATGDLLSGANVVIASADDRDISFDFADWVSGVVTAGPISIATGDNTVGSMVAGDLVLDGSLNLVSSGSGSFGTATFDSLDGEGDNSKQVKIVDGSGIGSTGTVAVAGNARIDDTWVGAATEAVGTLTVGGNLTITNGILHIAEGTDSKGTVEVDGLTTIKEIRVGEGVGSVGTLDLAALTLTANSGLLVGYGANSTGTVTLNSLDGTRNLDICTVGTDSTGTVTVDGDATVNLLRAAIKDDGQATLTVGGTLTVGSSWFNIGAGDRSHAEISATTINKVATNGLSIAKDIGVDAYASVVATDGLLNASNLLVGEASGSYGRLSIPGGTLNMNGYANIGTGANSTGIVEIAIGSFATNAVSIGTGSDAVGSLTLPGTETLYASELNLGDAGSLGEGTVSLAGGNLVVVGALDLADGSYIDVTSKNSTLTLVGRTESDYKALWATGALRSNGESGLTGQTFEAYFYVAGDTLSETPIGNIIISGPVAITGGQGMVLSWDTSDGQEYDVQSKSNLITELTWTTITNVTGTGGEMNVTTAVDNAESFYQVVTPEE